MTSNPHSPTPPPQSGQKSSTQPTRSARLLHATAIVLLGGGGLVLLLIGYAALSDGKAHSLLLSLLLEMNPDPPSTTDVQESLILVGREMVLRGGILLLAGGWLWGKPLFPAAARRLITWLNAHRRWVLITTMMAVAVFWLPVIWGGYSADMGGVRYWWLFDDAMISMRYARHLAMGVGLVWNPGEYIEGYTNFLWVLCMAVVHLFPISLAKTSLVMLLINLALAIAAVVPLLRLVEMLNGGVMVRVLVLASYALSRNIMSWTTAGAETALLTLMLLWAVVWALEDHNQQQIRVRTFILLGAMTLVRSDAVILAGLVTLIYLETLWKYRTRTFLLTFGAYVAILLTFPMGHTLFRLAYYGELLPNTAYLKVLNWDEKYIYGLVYVARFLIDYLFVCLLALVGTVVSRSRVWWWLFGLCMLFAGYVAYAGGDVFLQYRFFVPIIPIILVLAFVGVQQLAVRPSLRMVLVAFSLATIPLMVPGETTPLYSREKAIGNIKIALLLKENVPPETRVADFWAGLTFYHSDVHGIDLLGKNDPYIAQLPAEHGGVPGHNKYDFDYSLGKLHPDIVIGTFRVPVDDEEKEQLREYVDSIAPWRGALYFNETFRTHCLPYPIPVDTWRTLFACDWSPYAETREEWTVPFEPFAEPEETNNHSDSAL